ncbi:MAG: FtsW/RodA/SpoVE family cell cycle protein [Taibaiella sp.]|nr:FtsW/RodA/SpoVE family cell cycle protein [Taibaiella sp.]
MNKLLNKTKGDPIIWGVVILLSIISLVAVYSATGTFDYRHERNSSYFLVKQVMVLGFGLCITYLVHNVKYTKFARWAVLLYAVSLPLLAITLFFGKSVHGGARWIGVPGTSLTFQSSDLAKLALFMFIARVLSVKKDVIQDFKKGFLPVLLPMLVTCALIAPANLSTALMLGATCSIIFYIGRVRIRHIAFLVGVGLFGVTVLFAGSLATGHGRGRIWLTRMEDYAGKKQDGKKHEEPYQVEQAKVAIAYGGFTGRGPGNSIQKNFLPLPFSDFIYAIIIEEYGLLGGAFLIFLYLLFLWRSILIFKRCPYAFGAFLAVGLSITLVFQAMLNMGVNVNLLPVTGLTLPMVSMGGSSIWFTSVAIGIILSVSKYVDEEVAGGKKKGTRKVAKTPVATTVDDDDAEDADEENLPAPAPMPSKVFIKTGKKKPGTGVEPVPAI